MNLNSNMKDYIKLQVPLYQATSFRYIKQCFIEYIKHIHVSKEVHRIGQNVY